LNIVATLASMLESKIGADSMDPILLGLDRQIHAKGGDLAISSEQSGIH